MSSRPIVIRLPTGAPALPTSKYIVIELWELKLCMRMRKEENI